MLRGLHELMERIEESDGRSSGDERRVAGEGEGEYEGAEGRPLKLLWKSHAEVRDGLITTMIPKLRSNREDLASNTDHVGQLMNFSTRARPHPPLTPNLYPSPTSTSA